MDIQQKLRELKEMYEGGLISAAIYEQQQKAVLAGRTDGPMPQGDVKPTALGSGLLDPKKNLRALIRLAVLATVVLIGIWLVYAISGRDGKDAISQFASQTGIGKQVIPWSDRADTAARKLIDANKEKIAAAIQGVTHPSGKDPRLAKFGVSKLGDRVLVEMVIGWKGGLVGGDYSTTVTWEIGEQGHIDARVTLDSALTSVEQKNKEMLNEYFRTKVYPAFYADTHG
jgi:hypothetical protein